ncbi:AAA family ATPase [Rhodopseudomonas sp.]|uniref:AAA family ATPase n=1 Tax=Rhodopseudomonas sp. TaxID=1078 RepID=UPI003B3B6306
MAPLPKLAANSNIKAVPPQASCNEGEPPFRCIGGTPLEMPRYLIKGILPEAGVALLAGQFSAGKTFIGVDIALSLIYGKAFLGRKVKAGGVLWIAAEGSGEIDARVFAARRERFGDDSNSRIPFLCPSALPTGGPQIVVTELKGMIRATRGWFSEAYPDHPLRLVVIDTLPAFVSLQDENGNAEAAQLMKLLAAVGNEAGVLVMPITHFGKGPESGVRGASAFAAGADAILACKAEIDAQTGVVSGPRSLALTKSRRGGTGPLGTFSIAGTSIGYDEDQEPETAGYVVFGDGGSENAKKPPPHHVRVLLDAINEAILAHGSLIQIFPNEPPLKAVRVDHARDEFNRAYTVGDSAASNDAKRQAYHRAYKILRDGNRFGNRTVHGVEYLWLI